MVWKAHNDKQQKKINGDEWEMELTVEEIKTLDDGKHVGKIVEVRMREKPFKYVDLIIETQNGMKLAYGVPASLTVASKLGKLCLDFGASLEAGKKMDIDSIFVGKGCEFMTLNKKTDRGSFANVVHGSLKPVQG